MLKYFFKLLLLLALVFIVQSTLFLCLRHQFPAWFLPIDEVSYVDEHLKQSPDIVYLGDSVLWSYAYDETSDEDKASIPQYLRYLLPDLNIFSISQGGFQVDDYSAYCRYIIAHGYHPKAVIIPLNLNTFSLAVRDIIPRFEDLKAYLLNDYTYFVFYRPLTIFKSDIYNRSRKFLHGHLPIYFRGEKIGTFNDDLNFIHETDGQNTLVKGLRYYSLYEMKGHPFVQELIDMVHLLQAHHIEPIVYITPLPYGYIKQYLPPDESAVTDENISYLISTLNSQNIQVLNMGRMCPNDYFFWKYFPAAHVKKEGRQLIAFILSKYINSLPLFIRH